MYVMYGYFTITLFFKNDIWFSVCDITKIQKIGEKISVLSYTALQLSKVRLTAKLRIMQEIARTSHRNTSTVT